MEQELNPVEQGLRRLYRGNQRFLADLRLLIDDEAVDPEVQQEIVRLEQHARGV